MNYYDIEEGYCEGAIETDFYDDILKVRTGACTCCSEAHDLTPERLEASIQELELHLKMLRSLRNSFQWTIAGPRLVIHRPIGRPRLVPPGDMPI